MAKFVILEYDPWDINNYRRSKESVRSDLKMTQNCDLGFFGSFLGSTFSTHSFLLLLYHKFFGRIFYFINTYISHFLLGPNKKYDSYL